MAVGLAHEPGKKSLGSLHKDKRKHLSQLTSKSTHLFQFMP